MSSATNIPRSVAVEQAGHGRTGARAPVIPLAIFHPGQSPEGQQKPVKRPYEAAAPNHTSLVSPSPSKPYEPSLPPLGEWQPLGYSSGGTDCRESDGSLAEVRGRIRAQGHLPKTVRSRLRNHDKSAQVSLFIEVADEHGYGLFITVNLDGEERADAVISNLRRACNEVGHRLEPYGVEVEAYGKTRRHIHVVANVQAGTPAHRRIQAFAKARNKHKPRSVNVREVRHSRGGIANLIGYMHGARNGGRQIKSHGAHRMMEELGRRDLAPLQRRLWVPGQKPDDAPFYVLSGSGQEGSR